MTVIGHPRDPETFTFTETTSRDGRVRRIVKSHVEFDENWPWWRRNAVRLLCRALASVAKETRS